MTAGLFNGKALSPPSKTVNVFDLNAKQKGLTATSSDISSAKERAARITLYVILTLVVLTGISLLVGEAIGLQWTLCVKPANKTTMDTWYKWPWSWKHSGQPMERSVSESYKERWNTLSIPEKRKELFRATMGDVDLYDIYDISKDTQTVEIN